jgi:hypothetical protein
MRERNWSLRMTRVGERHCCLSITPLMRKSSPQRKEILRRRKR